MMLLQQLTLLTCMQGTLSLWQMCWIQMGPSLLQDYTGAAALASWALQTFLMLIAIMQSCYQSLLSWLLS